MRTAGSSGKVAVRSTDGAAAGGAAAGGWADGCAAQAATRRARTAAVGREVEFMAGLGYPAPGFVAAAVSGRRKQGGHGGPPLRRARRHNLGGSRMRYSAGGEVDPTKA